MSTITGTRPVAPTLAPAPNQSLVRSAPKGRLRAIEVEGQPTIQLQILRYGVVDSYGSVWLPGCLTKGLNARLPQLAWGHDWSDIIGRGTSWRDTADGPVVDFRLDDFDAVPRARQAYAQVKSGTVDDCSIGFAWGYEAHRPSAEELRRWPGATEIMEEADTDEVSLVLRGAVPGAKVVGVRSRQQRSRLLGLRSPQMIDAEAAARIITQFAADVERGEADLFTALEQVKNAAVPLPEDKPEDANDETNSDAPAETSDAADNQVQSEDTPDDETPDASDGEAVAETQDETGASDTAEQDEPAATDDTSESEGQATEPEPDPEFDQTMADIDNLLAEREAI